MKSIRTTLINGTLIATLAASLSTGGIEATAQTTTGKKDDAISLRGAG